MRFVPYLIHNGIMVSIVTFSGQVALISEVLKLRYGQECAEKIVIRGNDGSWGKPARRDGKIKHLASAAEEFERKYQDSCVEISRNSTILFDDDDANVRIALDKGVRAIWFNPDDSSSFLPQIIELL